jgi:hypothetical protein
VGPGLGVVTDPTLARLLRLLVLVSIVAVGAVLVRNITDAFVLALR